MGNWAERPGFPPYTRATCKDMDSMQRRRHHAQHAAGRFAAILVVLAAAGGCFRDDTFDGAAEVVAAFDEMSPAATRAWPGFEPKSIPLALYTRDAVLLVRHPDPPPGSKRAGRESRKLDWLPPRLRSPDPVKLEGAYLAAVPYSATGLDTMGVARRVMRAAFRVWLLENRPDWQPDEMAQAVYPISSATGLRLRRLETAAFRRAGLAPDSVRRVCWAGQALEIRERRFRSLPEAAAQYERQVELTEGLADYVVRRAARDTARAPLPQDGYPPADLRVRSRRVGELMAHLLDSFSANWPESLQSGSFPWLDAALAAALPPYQTQGCRLPADEVRRALALARRDSARFEEKLTSLIRTHDEALGWRLSFEPEGDVTLRVDGLDPESFQVLDDSLVLHTGWIRLVGRGVVIEIQNRPAMTRAAGEHPIADGISELQITGILSEPGLAVSGDTVRLAARGLRAVLEGASVEKDGRRWVIRLHAPDVLADASPG